VSAQASDGAAAVAPAGDVTLRRGNVVEGILGGAGAGTLHVYGVAPAAREDRMLPLLAKWDVSPDGRFSGALPAGARAWGVFEGVALRIRGGEIVLPELTSIAGRVTRSDGRAAAHAVLLFRPLLDADFPPLLPSTRIAADETGAFSSDELMATRYAVEVSAPGCATRIVNEVDPGASALEITLEPGYSVSGVIRDRDGLPVREARVQAVGLPEEGDRPFLKCLADDSGRFHVVGLGGTRARLRITARGYAPKTINEVAPDAKLRIKLDRAR